METAADKGGKRGEWNVMGKQALFPMEQVTADDRPDIAFINAGGALHNSRKVMAAVSLAGNFSLVRGRDLGIRDNEGRQEGMGLFTFTAEHTLDAHADRAGRCFEGAVVIGMDGKAAGMATGARELVELEVCGNRVINFLDFFRHRVEIRQKKGYHSLTGRR